MKQLWKVALGAAVFFVCSAQAQQVSTLSGTVADYNAAQVAKANGALTVPGGYVTYTAGAAIPSGTSFVVTLPTGFSFTSAPSLSTSQATATLNSHTGGTATFTIQSSSIIAGDTITLGGYSVSGATALESITSPEIGLPISMQAIGVDASPVTMKEFASDSGIQAVFVGAIQFIDLTSPSNGSMFGVNGMNDTPTAVLSAIAIESQIADESTGSIPILGADGNQNTLDETDTVQVIFPGFKYGGLKSVFASHVSSCVSSIAGPAYVTPNALIFNNIPLNQEVFFCVTGNGQPLQLYANPMDENAFGLTSVYLNAQSADTDFLSSANVNVEFPGYFCYLIPNGYFGFISGDCAPQYYLNGLQAKSATSAATH